MFFFFFNDTATTEIYTLSLHDALPISARLTNALQKLTPKMPLLVAIDQEGGRVARLPKGFTVFPGRSEEHTSELQSLAYLVCRLLLEKKKLPVNYPHTSPYHTVLSIVY